MTKDIVIFDLDGTLANIEHRLHHIQKKPKDWRSFFAACDGDKPYIHIVKLLKCLANDGHQVWIVSGRSDECMDKTVAWLTEHIGSYDRLIMRKEGDFTDDDALKKRWLYDGTIPRERVFMVFDDRKRVVDVWRAAHLPCLQVAAGDF